MTSNLSPATTPPEDPHASNSASTSTTVTPPASAGANATLAAASSSSSSGAQGAAAAAAAAAADKPRLSEQEKKNNHIASEQKRRQAIREGFDEIADLVPGLKGQGRSEAIVLQGATQHVKQLLAERVKLLEAAKRRKDAAEAAGMGGVDLRRWEMDVETAGMARSAVQEMRNGEAGVNGRRGAMGNG